MMKKSIKSKDKLQTCDKRLIKLFEVAVNDDAPLIFSLQKGIVIKKIRKNLIMKESPN